VSNLIRLLDLPEPVVGLIDSKALGMGHARALLGLEGDGERERLARLVAERGLSVRETETLVRKSSEAKQGEGAHRPELPVISEILKTKSVHVQLHQKASGAARIVVDVADETSRDVVLAALKQAAD